MKEGLTFGATMTADLIRDGKVVDTRTVHNMVVNAGYDLVCDLIANPSTPNIIGYVGVGTGTAETTAATTSLGTQWGNRIATTYSHTAGTTQLTLTCTVPAHTGATVALTESGLFNAATSGTMFDRVTFSSINKEPADTINIQYVINLVQES